MTTGTTVDVELIEPCPFCEATWVVINRPANGSQPSVKCKACNASGPYAAGWTDAQIMAAWNKRSAATRIEQLRKALETISGELKRYPADSYSSDDGRWSYIAKRMAATADAALEGDSDNPLRVAVANKLYQQAATMTEISREERLLNGFQYYSGVLESLAGVWERQGRKEYADLLRGAKKTLIEHREALVEPSPDGWEGIESAPFDKMFLAAIHHGQAGYVVCQAKRTVAGVFDVMEDSCVGWRPGYKPAFWQPLPAPPNLTKDEESV